MADGGASSLLLGEGTRIARDLLSGGAAAARGAIRGGAAVAAAATTTPAAPAAASRANIVETLLKTGLLVASGVALTLIGTRLGSPNVSGPGGSSNPSNVAAPPATPAAADDVVASPPPPTPNANATRNPAEAPAPAPAPAPSSVVQQQQPQQQRTHHVQRVVPPPNFVRAKKVGRSPWQQIAVLGQGANGIVYKGINIETGQIVAIKVMLNAAGDRELRREMEILKDLRHPNLVDIIDFEVLPASQVAMHGQGCCRLVQTLCGNGTLVDLQKLTGAVPEPRLREYVRQMLSGMQALHEHDPPIIHRDLKPANILVGEDGTCRIADFGLSRFAHTMRDITRLAGTPLYLAPESVRGHFSVGSDIWAMGATAVQLLTNRLPWHGQAPMDNNATLMFYLQNVPTDPEARRRHRPNIPAGLLSPEGVAFFNTVFDIDPKRRGTCAELLRHPWVLAATPNAATPVVVLASSAPAAAAAASGIAAPPAAPAAAAIPSAAPAAAAAASGRSGTTGSSTNKSSGLSNNNNVNANDNNDEDDDGDDRSDTSSLYDSPDYTQASLDSLQAQQEQQRGIAAAEDAGAGE